MSHEQILNACACAVFAEFLLLAKYLRRRMDHRISLILPDKRWNSYCEVRLSRKPSTYTERIANLFFTTSDAFDCSKCYVINFRIGAPQRATRDRDLKLARQIIEVRIRRKFMSDLD